MKTLKSNFTNEHGNFIAMVVQEHPDGVTITATGPTSTVEHTWTHREIAEIKRALHMFEGENTTYLEAEFNYP